MKDATIKQVLAYEKYFKDNPEERRRYEQREKAILDYNSDIAEAHDAGFLQGEEKGIQKGTLKMIRLVMDSWGITFPEAMDKMNIPQQEREVYRELLGQ